MIRQNSITLNTPGRGALEITDSVNEIARQSGIDKGLCNLFLHHTSASLIISENADPQVLRDLEAFMQRLVPDGDAIFRHREEGQDDMPAHVRAVLTQVSLTIPITAARLALGTWQGVYLWEHRTTPHARKITISLNGE